LSTAASTNPTLGLGDHTLTFTVTDSRGLSAASVALISVRDTTPPALTLPPNVSVAATSPAGAIVTFPVTAVDLVDGTIPVACTPPSGATFPAGTTTVDCSAVDAQTNRSSGTFRVTVHPINPAGTLSRFVALGADRVWLRANSRVVTGDVGANRAIPGIHRPWNADDDGEPDLRRGDRRRERCDVAAGIASRRRYRLAPDGRLSVRRSAQRVDPQSHRTRSAGQSRRRPRCR
jgi:HYR domain